jgi:outer membrane protein
MLKIALGALALTAATPTALAGGGTVHDLTVPSLASYLSPKPSRASTSTAPVSRENPGVPPTAQGAAAEERSDRALVPLPSIFDFTGGEGWGIALGVGLEYEAAYDGSDEYELEVDPAGAIQWRTGDNLFFLEGTELGWRGLFDQRWLIQIGTRYESGLDPSDSEEGRLDGIAERDSHLVGFVEARYALDDAWRNWIGGRVLAGESDFGALGVLAAGHRFGDQTDGQGTEIYAFTTFGDSAFINKDFGVTAQDSASSGLAETKLDSGYRSFGMQAIYRRQLTDHLQLITQAGFELFSSDIGESPIARDDYEAELSLAAVWRF